MSVVVEPTFIHHRRLQRILAGVAEGWMADIVREAQRLGQILVEPERSRDRPPDLRDFEAVRQPDAKMVAVGRQENLRLVTQPADRKSTRLNPVTNAHLVCRLLLEK